MCERGLWFFLQAREDYPSTGGSKRSALRKSGSLHGRIRETCRTRMVQTVRKEKRRPLLDGRRLSQENMRLDLSPIDHRPWDDVAD